MMERTIRFSSLALTVFLLLFFQSCQQTGVAPDSQQRTASPEQLRVTDAPDGHAFYDFYRDEHSRTKTGDAQSPADPNRYSCYMSRYVPGEGYYFKSVYLNFPNAVTDGMEKESMGIMRWTRTNEAVDHPSKIEALMICRIPQTRKAAKLVVDYFDLTGNFSIKPTKTKGEIYSDFVQRSSISDSSSNSGDEIASETIFPRMLDGGIPNDEGFTCMSGTDWISYDQEYCTDGTDLYFPVVPIEEPDPGDGGSGSGGGGRGNDLPGDGNGGPVHDPAPRLGEGEPVPAEEELAVALEENEYLLMDVPCSEIPDWQALAQHIPPQSVIDKLEQEYYGDIDILSIEDAAGTVVNTDYFSINVNTLPSGMTAIDLLNSIRNDINNFINTDLASFSPYDYTGYSFDEAAVWYSSNPMGAVLSIDLKFPVDDGSVVVSGFNSNSWTFSTVSDPWNFDHPVSGNRKFGFVQNANGSYTFFTRGVDRITQQIDNFVAQNLISNPFEDPDALWSSFQKKLKNYINQHGGNATSATPIKYRPNWEKVKNVLNGQASIQILGCN